MLVALYTGTRSGAVCRASFRRSDHTAWIDTDAGVFWRRAPDARITAKRQPATPLSRRLLAHLRRWKRRADRDGHRDGGYVVEYKGRPVRRVTKGFRGAVAEAGLDPSEVTPHTLRHTAATWLMQAGADPWAAAGFLGMSVEVLTSVYGHWHPDFGREAAEQLSKGANT
ncbi:MAG: tyrosine-type recombinase/integrase [Cupriavidus sp.]|nr:tyrosine-type recombinase/integrase [Cupriavidus sp.]